MPTASVYKHGLCWLRRDLRTRDHQALSQAILHSKTVTVVFIFDTCILNTLEDKTDRRVVYIHRSLQEIDSFLQKMGSKLVVLKGDPSKEIPKLALRLESDAVFANLDVDPYAKQRDQKVSQALEKKEIEFHTYKDHVIFAKDEIVNQKGEPFKVFTPYKNKWLSMFDSAMVRDVTLNRYNFTPLEKLTPVLKPWRLKDIGFKDCEILVDPGQEYAQMRLKTFERNIDLYDQNRDYPAKVDATSNLSVALRFGTMSVRECMRMALAHQSKGAKVWMSELIWREFYQMLLDQYPDVVSKAFQEKYENIKWPGSKKDFESWTKGQTGYPLVDAAMRCLNETGMMHNRLRMITAMFLTKDLLVDWKRGEQYFAKHLLDFELASNNGGWQWSASVGCDAQPYFRIFNPTTQSKKFDPQSTFIRQFCPELIHFSDRWIHEPSNASVAVQKDANCVIGKDYPAPIVDHAVMRQKAIALFKAV